MRFKWNSYGLLTLYVPLLYVFYIVMTWSACKPISDIGNYAQLMADDTVPDGSTCFLTNHMTSISFHSYPDLGESLVYFIALVALLLTLTAILFTPTFRLFKFGRYRKKET